MDDVQTMKIADGSCDLPEVEWCKALLTVSPIPDFFKKTAVSSQFQKEVDFAAVAKKSIEFEDIGMVSEQLYFNLLTHLSFHTCLANVFFVNHFNR